MGMIPQGRILGDKGLWWAHCPLNVEMRDSLVGQSFECFDAMLSWSLHMSADLFFVSLTLFLCG